MALRAHRAIFGAHEAAWTVDVEPPSHSEGDADFINHCKDTAWPWVFRVCIGHESDFGQTPSRYRVGTDFYILSPLADPSDIRGGLGLVVDSLSDRLAWTTGGLTTTFGQMRGGVSVTQARVDNDDQMTTLRRDFTDPYATLRSAYTQARARQIREARGEAAVDESPTALAHRQRGIETE